MSHLSHLSVRAGFVAPLAVALLACSSVSRVNPELGSGPRRGRSENFSFSCSFLSEARDKAPSALRRLCQARRAERVTVRRTPDGGLRVRIRFADARRQSLELFVYPDRAGVRKGAVLVERDREGGRREVEPDSGWVAVDYLDVQDRSVAARYALSFGNIRVGGSVVENRTAPAPGSSQPDRPVSGARARRP